MRLVRLLSVVALLAAEATASAGEASGPAPPPNGPAPAAACTDKPEVCGREAFKRGVRAYRDNDFETAVVEFSAALTYKWHPSIALNLGLAEARAGKYLAAIHEFDSVLADATTDAKLRDQATEERDRASAELAAIEIDPGAGTMLVVRIDGASVDARAPVMVDPGSHHVEIDLSGRSVVRDVALSPREHLRLSIDRTREIVVVPSPEPEKPAAAPAAPPPRPRAHRRGLAPVWFFAGAGVTVALGAVATWSALDTKSAFDSYERDLPRLDQAQANQRVDDGHGLETRTNVLFAATGVFAIGTAAVGVFLVDWKPSAESALVLLPGGAAYRGRF